MIYCIRQGIFRKGSFGHYEIQVPTRGMEELRHSSDDKASESAVTRDGALPLTSREATRWREFTTIRNSHPKRSTNSNSCSGVQKPCQETEIFMGAFSITPGQDKCRRHILRVKGKIRFETDACMSRGIFVLACNILTDACRVVVGLSV